MSRSANAHATSNTPRRALVTDVEERSALAACRGLAKAGYRVTGVSGMRPAAGQWSRACDRRVHLPDPREAPDAFLDGLEQTLAGEPHTIVLPGTDLTLRLVSDARERLEPLARLAVPTAAAVDAALDKRWLVAHAAAAGLDSPASTTCTTVEEGLAAAAELGYPVIVKPVSSFVRRGDHFRQERVRLATDAAGLADSLPGFGTEFIIQRYLGEGQVVSTAGVMTSDGLLAFAAVRWQRRWPVDSGATSFCRTVVPPDGLADAVERLLRAAAFEGVFELELLELDNGRLAAIDLNPRIFGWLSLPIAAGANLPALFCDRVLGGHPAAVTATAGIPYRWEDGDALHFFAQLRRRRLRAAAAVLVPHRHTVHALFRPGDPGPLFARIVQLARLRARRRRPAPGHQAG